MMWPRAPRGATAITKRRRARGIAAGQVELLITIATIALAVSTALVKVAGPKLVKMFRHDQIAAASPMP